MVSLYVGFYYLPFLGQNSCTQSRIMNFVYLFLCIMNFELNPTIERKDIQAKKVCSDIFCPLTLKCGWAFWEFVLRWGRG